MEKIKILYVISSLKPCGPDNVMYEIIKNIDHNKFAISVLALSNAENKKIQYGLTQMGVDCYLLGVSRKMFLFKGWKKAKEIIKKIKPDIVHAHCIRSAILIGFLKNTDLLKFVTIHNYPHLDYVYGYGKIIGKIAGVMMIKAIQKFDFIIACSSSISTELKNKFSVSTLYIRNGVRENKYIGDKIKLRNKLHIPTGKKVILSVGSITNLKNSAFLVNSLGRIKDNIYIIFLGDGPARKFCEKNKTDNMHFLGHKTNVDEYLAAADIYVSASKTEGLPLSVLEALNSGTPVLLSDIDPHKEILSVSDKMIGYTFKQNDINDFLQKLTTMLLDENINLMSMNAVKVGRGIFSSKNMGENYEKLYLQAMRG